MASERGHRGGVYGFFAAVMWFGCEVVGFIAGYLLLGRDGKILSYFLALAGAGVGALVAWLVANNLEYRNTDGFVPLLPNVMHDVPTNSFSSAPKEPVWCINCGTQLPSKSKFCDKCGTKVPSLD